MAVLYVKEFAIYATGNDGHTSDVLKWDPTLQTQTVAISGTSTATTKPFDTRTRFIEIETDSICSIDIGPSPVASATTMRLNAGDRVRYGVDPGQGWKVAVITNS